MSKYKVLSDFTFRGAKRKAGEIIELSEGKLAKLQALGFGDKVEAVGNGSEATMSDEQNTGAETPATPETPAAPSTEGEGTPAPAPSTEGGEGTETPAGETGADQPAA